MVDAARERSGRSRRGWSVTARSLAFASGLALLLVLLVAGGIFARWLLTPPAPEVCPLPVLNVPRAGDVLSWSADGQRLLVVNRIGEASVVRLPDLEVDALPPFAQTPWGAAWDAKGRPLLIYRLRYPIDGLARLKANGGGWERLPLRGMSVTLSPSGERLAMLEGDRTLQVQATDTLRPLARFYLPAAGGYQLIWGDEETVLVNASPREIPETLEYRLDRPGPPRRLARRGYPPMPVLVRYQSRKVPGAEIRRMLREWKVPGVPDWPNTDWSLSIKSPQGKLLRSIPLGRRNEGQRTRGYTHTWKAAAFSPDYRYLAVRAPDDTLRLLDLGASTAAGEH